MFAPQKRYDPAVASVAALLLAATLLPAHAAPTAVTASTFDAEALDLSQVGSGELLWKSGYGLIPLPVADLDVDLQVTGIMVAGRVSQRFYNPTTETIEAVYVFPLPPGAAVHHMELEIGDRRIVSVVREREVARRTYEAAKTAGKKAALLDQQRGNLFTTAAANIGPGETVSVVLRYLHEASYESGAFQVRFPLTYTPRFIPPLEWGDRSAKPRYRPWTGAALQLDDPDLDAHRDVDLTNDGELMQPLWTAPNVVVPLAKVRLKLDAGLPVERIASGSHRLQGDPEREGDFDTGEIAADRDFVFDWSVKRGEEPESAVFVEDREDGRYAMVMVMPPMPESDTGLGLPTETLFVIDVSGSMKGTSIRKAREALLAAVGRLRPGDRFNLLKFNDGFAEFRDVFLPVTEATIEEARDWILDLHADGGTMIYPALLRGLELMHQARQSANAQRIVFLTDGAISNEHQILSTLANQLGRVRLHAIGLGDAPNEYLMRKMARRGHGLCTIVSGSDDAQNAIADFFARLDRPVLQDVTLDWVGVDDVEAYPTVLPDLYAEDPLLLSVRIPDGQTGGGLVLRGYSRLGHHERKVTLTSAATSGSGIATRWARARVGSLMDSLHEGADPELVRQDVVDVALEFNLVTRFTSLVAVDQTPAANRVTRLAANLPKGGAGSRLRLLAALIFTAIGLAILAAGLTRAAERSQTCRWF